MLYDKDLYEIAKKDAWERRMESKMNQNKMTVAIMVKLPEMITKDVTKRRDDAAAGGQMTDNGAQDLENRWAAYVAGYNEVIPAWLRDYITEADRQADPEYQEYIRLNEKFGGII